MAEREVRGSRPLVYKKRPITRLTPHQLSSRLCYLRKRRQTLADAGASADVLAELDRRIAELAVIPATVRRRDRPVASLTKEQRYDRYYKSRTKMRRLSEMLPVCDDASVRAKIQAAIDALQARIDALDAAAVAK